MRTLLLLLTLLLTSCGSSGGGSTDDPTPTADRLAGTYTLTGFTTIAYPSGDIIDTQDDVSSWSGDLQLNEDGTFFERHETLHWQGDWTTQGDQIVFDYVFYDTNEGTYVLDGDRLTITYEVTYDVGDTEHYIDYWERNP